MLSFNFILVVLYLYVKYFFGQQNWLTALVVIIIFTPVIPPMFGSVVFMLSLLCRCCLSFARAAARAADAGEKTSETDKFLLEQPAAYAFTQKLEVGGWDFRAEAPQTEQRRRADSFAL